LSRPDIYRLPRVTSTLDVLHEYAAQGAPHGTVVVAEEQLEGRGTRGRPWHSPPGGLWYSILYRNVAEALLEFLSIRIGLALAVAMEKEIPGLRLGLKWPNDLMLGAGKVGGVLCEARWQGTALGWVAVGVGINVTNRMIADLDQPAALLSDGRPEVTVDQLVEPVTAALMSLPSASTLDSAELAGFSDRDWLRGKSLVEPMCGIGRGIGPDGALLVEQPDGSIVPVRAGRILLG
jgi:BirA family biotin operon repressor/biotin-[acetyl-CoA-carboxylase] ligase